MAQCQTLYGTTTVSVLSTSLATDTVTVTLAPTTTVVSSTSYITSCSTIAIGVPSGRSIAVPDSTTCQTTSTVIVQTSTIPGQVVTSTEIDTSTVTSYQTSVFPSQTSCTTPPAPAPPPPAQSTTTTTTPPSSSSSLMVSTIVVTTTLPNGSVSTSSSVTGILVPIGQDNGASSGGSSVPTGAIVGATLGGVAAMIVLALLLLGCCKGRGPFACLSSVHDDPDGLDEEYWAPAVPASSSQDEEDMLAKTAGGGRTSSQISQEDMLEYHHGAFHQRSPSNGAESYLGVDRRSSTFSYLSGDGSNRPRSPPLHYPSGPPSMHSSPSYYSTYMPSIVTTAAPGPAGMYYPAQYPVTTAEYHSGLVRHTSTGSMPQGVMTAQPYYHQAAVQRSRSAQSARTMSYMQGQRLSHWAEGDETSVYPGEEEVVESPSSVEGTLGSPIGPPQDPPLRLVTTNADISPSIPAEQARGPTEGRWLASS